MTFLLYIVSNVDKLRFNKLMRIINSNTFEEIK